MSDMSDHKGVSGDDAIRLGVLSLAAESEDDEVTVSVDDLRWILRYAGFDAPPHSAELSDAARAKRVAMNPMSPSPTRAELIDQLLDESTGCQADGQIGLAKLLRSSAKLLSQ